MRAWGWSLLAVLPWMGPVDSPSLPLRESATCRLAIDVRVETPLRWGSVEWHLFTREAERLWAPYGLTLCWQRDGKGCDGLSVQLQVHIGGALAPAGRAETPPVVGRIRFYDGEPGTEIFLSIDGARFLVSRATLGGRAVATWPGLIADRLLPGVVGRALAHEIGHFVLGSKAHTRNGLMAARFQPDLATFAADSSFRLSAEQAGTVRLQCLAGTLDAGRAPASPATWLAE